MAVVWGSEAPPQGETAEVKTVVWAATTAVPVSRGSERGRRGGFGGFAEAERPQAVLSVGEAPGAFATAAVVVR